MPGSSESASRTLYTPLIMTENANLTNTSQNGILVALIKCSKVGDFEATPLRSDIEKDAANTGWKVVVDMSQVVLLGSQGIGMLVQLKKSCEAKKGKMVLCGLSDDLYGVMKISALTKLFTIKTNQKDALSAF